MRIPSNKISDIIYFFRRELSAVYSSDELESIIWLCFNHLFGFSKSELTLKNAETINQSDLLKLNFICKDLKTGRPVQYVWGETEFCGLNFFVDENVLIPRPETEELVELVNTQIKENYSDKSCSVLDIGTGSGCIAIAVKKKNPLAKVSALDVSEGALSVARKNSVLNKTEINFIEGDILNAGSFTQTETFDLIVSNPPYITFGEKDSLEKNVIQFEPHLALFASENDPLIFYHAIIDYCSGALNPGGFLFFELNPAYAKEINDLLNTKNFEAEILMDIFGKLRFTKARKR
jgi:release factor glutamine methyltransferase